MLIDSSYCHVIIIPLAFRSPINNLILRAMLTVPIRKGKKDCALFTQMSFLGEIDNYIQETYNLICS